MPVFLNSADPGFETAFAALLGQKREEAEDVDHAVAQIIADVRARGDAAVIELTARFDRLELTPETLAFSARRDRGRDAPRSRPRIAPRWNWPPSASAPTTPARSRRMTAGPMPAARRLAGAGRRFPRRGFMCRGDGVLSVLGADERDPGQGGGGRTPGHRLPDAGRRGQSAGPAGRADRRGRDGLPHRRRAGDCRAGLRHRRRSPRSTRSPAPAMPMSPPPSAGSSAASAST